jgi:hypothetical protein
MSVLRGVGKGAGGFFFCIFLALAVLPWGLYNFTDYDNLAPFFADTVKEQIGSKVDANNLELIKSALLAKCKSTGDVEFPLEGQKIILDCDEISAADASELPSLVGVAMFENVYYREYSCNFIDCLSQAQDQDKFFLLVSKKGHDYYFRLACYLLAGAVMSLILLVMSSKRWSKLINPGICMMVIGLNYFFLKYFKARMGDIPSQVSGIIFSSFTSIFLKLLIIGAVLTAAGIILNLIFKKNDQNPPAI